MAKQREENNAVIDLQSEGIAAVIANRQLAVISKAYAYLSQPGNNIIYIADEVGLGKTYIGLGIAALLRHFSRNPAQHVDLMIVPKKNLQDKWLKELRNFAQNNYKGGDYFKDAVSTENVIHNRLRAISPEQLFTIFRMTSFSSLITSRQRVREYLQYEVFRNDPFCTGILWQAYDQGYFNKPNKSLLVRLVACLLNAVSSKVDCLIVDEAHNFKYGPGGEDGDGAVRNQVTGRFLGAIKDKDILKAFPDLQGKMKYPLAKKVICLSATPKDRQLWEIKNQLDCLMPKHLLKDVATTEDIKTLLPLFLIRGNMEYRLNGIDYSRNQCRHEHRQGNVTKDPEGKQITLGDDLDNIFWQLLQYKSIRHLSQKANASFEIGMLAGFESYQLDMDKRVAEQGDDEDAVDPGKEYEILQSRNQKISQDANVVRSLVGSYKDAFGNEPPPHPKLSKLETELLRQFANQEKALIFVRRIATVDELLRHLLQRYDQELVNSGYLSLGGKWARYLTEKVRVLRKACQKFYNDRKRSDILTLLNESGELDTWWRKLFLPAYLERIELLRYAYANENVSLISLLDDHLIHGKFRRSQKQTALNSLKALLPVWQEQLGRTDEDIPEDEETEIRADSFFKDYFKKGRSSDGFNFRKKIYRENWYDFNYYQLFSSDQNWKTTAFSAKNSLGAFLPELEGRRPHQVFAAYQDAFNITLTKPETPAHRLKTRKGGNPLSKSTFLTELLLKCCQEEWEEWKNKHRNKEWPELLNELAVLNSLLQSVFQHGSGLLPSFVADAKDGDFTRDLIGLLKEPEAPFHFVLHEVRTIIKDFSLIVSVNFQERDPKKVIDRLKNSSPVIGASGQDKNRSAIAARFRMPGFPYALVATDIFHEGEDLHTYCQSVYHYGIAWNPSSIEQRTGRVDRINSLSYRKLIASQDLNFSNKVQVFYPYLSRSVEVNQVVKLLGHVNRFLEDFNKIDSMQRYDSEVNIAEEVTESDIPKAITSRIYSKYDVEHFKGI
jgi:hypothetical protein